jgi:hypothetical protein
MHETVACGIATSVAISRGPQPVRARTAQTRSWSPSERSRGERRGREERSSKQASDARSSVLAARHRATQQWAVDFATFEAAAAASNV